MDDKELKKQPTSSFWLGAVLLTGLIFIFAIWLGTFAWVWKFEHFDQSGQIGDSFGVVNSLFTGLSSFGVIYAIYLQYQELKEQRQDILRSQDSQSKAAEVMKAQMKATQMQFEINALGHVMTVLDSRIKDASSSFTMRATDGEQEPRRKLVNERDKYEELLVMKVRDYFSPEVLALSNHTDNPI